MADNAQKNRKHRCLELREIFIGILRAKLFIRVERLSVALSSVMCHRVNR